ncbi:XRE family transcriptional regulator of biofilm formation [Pullulanibacillus pueri]|uniref:Transcriptional regulator n=1 Tax=Pullulanibacillus pueri TaxID=1437324 RepID=A0A8J2ZVS8_9BACL|nr:helix-turn-helix transcriptional regulator [Pullulanibacillus pueri]MBM7682430.1 XRE family transcriptional regulator of biofilm formation [Pullulanibacillus pueri]GGH81669.1 transcriptional regulator [Pullulanibacillus pueri]
MIGRNIQEVRKERGFTLSEVADQAHISKSYLSNIERNVNKNPSIQVLKKIALALDVDLRVILNGIKQQPQPLEKEWLDFIYDLKTSGIDKDQVKDYRTLIEFIQWQKRKENDTCNDNKEKNNS